jgi:chorismate mutase/prephenate dehydratase
MPHAKIRYFSDTALSVGRSRTTPIRQAAIAKRGGGAPDLSVIERGIANQEENYTRFLVAARKPVRVDSPSPARPRSS